MTNLRLNFEFSQEQVDQLNKLKRKTGVSSMKELFSNAFTMLDWAVDEVQGGREIAALSVEKDNYRVFVTPLLRQVGPVPVSQRRVRGVLKGQIKLSAEFDESLPAELLADFEGRE